MLCKCPQLSPLQSRFVASLLALGLLVVVYWSLSSPHFAYAAELEHDGSGAVRGGEDHNWHRLHDEALVADSLEDAEDVDTSTLATRQEKSAAEPSAIGANNEANNLNIVEGETTVWQYPRDLLMGEHADKGTGLPDDYIYLGIVQKVDRQMQRKRRDLQIGDNEDVLKRQAGRQVFISMNTCLQPSYNGTGTQRAAPPQLTLYVGQGSNKEPGPESTGPQTEHILDEGFVQANLTASEDLYMAVHAPELPDGFTGGWNYELAVSIDDFYHGSETKTPYLFLVDSDTSAALLVTGNLTVQADDSEAYSGWMNRTAPFILFAHNVNDTRTLGLGKSYCGLKSYSSIQGSQDNPTDSVLSSVNMGMITRGVGDRPKEQFYITALNASSSYQGHLAMPGNSTHSGSGVVGGGGTIWPTMNWTTKADGNCQLLFNLSFCDKVAYAVPSNQAIFPNLDTLAAEYDSYAAGFYKNFTYTLDQIPCNATSDAQYSLAKNCDDCANAYKEWLCAVTMPRCEDWSNDKDFLQERNMGQPFLNDTMLSDELLGQPYDVMSGAPQLPGSPALSQTYNSTLASNQSRNHGLIDGKIMPGPYKEVLPCEDLCYSLVQSCPAKLGFTCPAEGRGLEASYGKRADNDIQCSFLGAVYYLNDARTASPGVWAAVGFAGLVGLRLGVW